MPDLLTTASTSGGAWFGWLGLIGGFAGLATLVWRVSDYFRAFLTINLTSEVTDAGGIRLRSEISNPNMNKRSVHGVFIIVSPADEAPSNTYDSLVEAHNERAEYGSYNEMVRQISERIRADRAILRDNMGRMLIPLPYYFRENIGVADETLSFEVIVKHAELPAGVYSARLYVDALGRYHRLVQAAFDVAEQPQVAV